MGCDIHIVVERPDGDRPGQWYGNNVSFLDEAKDRSYNLFTWLAGVRDYDRVVITPISKPRGLPDDLSALAKSLSMEFGGADHHSFSHLTKRELVDNLPESDDVDSNDCIVHRRFRYFIRDMEDDARIVFWFDS